MRDEPRGLGLDDALKSCLLGLLKASRALSRKPSGLGDERRCREGSLLLELGILLELRILLLELRILLLELRIMLLKLRVIGGKSSLHRILEPSLPLRHGGVSKKSIQAPTAELQICIR